MQDLAVPVCPTVVFPNCFGTTLSAVATASPAATMSLCARLQQATVLVSFLLVAMSIATDVVRDRFANFSCWSVVL